MGTDAKIQCQMLGGALRILWKSRRINRVRDVRDTKIRQPTQSNNYLRPVGSNMG